MVSRELCFQKCHPPQGEELDHGCSSGSSQLFTAFSGLIDKFKRGYNIVCRTDQTKAGVLIQKL
jgi:hypothetical protein